MRFRNCETTKGFWIGVWTYCDVRYVIGVFCSPFETFCQFAEFWLVCWQIHCWSNFCYRMTPLLARTARHFTIDLCHTECLKDTTMIIWLKGTKSGLSLWIKKNIIWIKKTNNVNGMSFCDFKCPCLLERHSSNFWKVQYLNPADALKPCIAVPSLLKFLFHFC